MQKCFCFLLPFRFYTECYTKKHLFCFWTICVCCWVLALLCSAAWIYLQHRNNFWSQPASVLLLWSFLSWSGRCVFFADLHGYMPESVLFFLLQSLLLQERVMELNFHCWVYSHPKRSRLLLCSLWHLFYPEIPVSRQSFRLQSLQHFTWEFWFSQRTLEVQWSSLSHISLWYMLQHEMLVILHLESAVVQLQQLLHIICSVMSASESAHGKILWQSIRMRDIRLCSHSLPLVPGAGSAWDYTRVLQNLSLLSRTILSSVQSVRN